MSINGIKTKSGARLKLYSQMPFSRKYLMLVVLWLNVNTSQKMT